MKENRYLLKTPDIEFVLNMSSEYKVQLIDLRSYYTIIPVKTFVEHQILTIITSSFMDTNLQEKLIVPLKEHSEFSGKIADYGEMKGTVEIYSGLTPYEEMMNYIHSRNPHSIRQCSDEEMERRIDCLLEQMTLKEKIGQLSQSAGEDVSEIGGELDGKPMLDQIMNGEVGSIIYIGYSPEALYFYQKKAVENTRLGIPLLVCQDVIHGFQTIFPIPLAQSCSFDMELIEHCASISAAEASASGIMCGFAPMVDLVRDPRWGRVCESPGEDPYLGEKIAQAYIKGYQGESLFETDTIAACLKHFIGYGACEAGRDYNTVELSRHTLENFYLPAFKKGVEAGSAMVMSSFNIIDGVPVSANQDVLKNILRKQLKFDGIIISDYAGVKEVGVHGVGENEKDIVGKVFDATVDIEMATSYYNYFLEKLVEEGRIKAEKIDSAVRRVLRLKYRLGIMDDPYRYIQADRAEKIIYSEEHLHAARRLAEESIVLLKNEGILPLKKEMKIALMGPCADSKDMLGPWQFSNYQEKCITIREGLENAGFSVIYTKGCEIEDAIENGIEDALKIANLADVVVVALGESSSMSGEAASRQNISVPEVQMDLVKHLKKTKKPVIVTITSGRPLLLQWFEEHADALIQTWFLGAEAGNAIASIMKGCISPSGRLTMSFPKNAGQIPIYYNYYNTGRPYVGDENRFVSRYIDGDNEPLYPFGYGLTYGKSEINGKIELSNNVLYGDKSVSAVIEMQNYGDRVSIDVIQLYIHDKKASCVRPVKELRGFQRIELVPGEKKKVKFEIRKDMLGFRNQDGEFIVEEGKFEIMIGKNSSECNNRKATFVYQEEKQEDRYEDL